MVQVVIYLQQTESALVKQTTFEIDTLRHEFQVIRLWEQPTENFFRYPGLLPYAALSQHRLLLKPQPSENLLRTDAADRPPDGV